MALFTRKPQRRHVTARAITSSAKVIDPGSTADLKELKDNRDPSEADCWRWNRVIEEVKFGARFMRNACSRVTLPIAIIPDQDADPIPLTSAIEQGLVSGYTPESPQYDVPVVDKETTDLAVEAMAEMMDGQDREGALLGSWGAKSFIVGDGYLIGYTVGRTRSPVIEQIDALGDEETRQRWILVAPHVLVENPTPRDGESKFALKGKMGNNTTTALPGDAFMMRIYREHEEWPEMADSLVRGVLLECEELYVTQRAIKSVALSKLSAPILVIANEFSPGGDVPQNDDSENPSDDPLTAAYVDHVTTPIAALGTAAEVAGLVLRVPLDPDGTGKYKPADGIFTVDATRKIDETVIQRCTYLISRIRAGLEFPTELYDGLGSVNHWCVDDTTEALTIDGWRAQADLNPGDLVLTLNHATGLSEWQPVIDIYRADVTDEPMILMDGAGHSSMTTPGHRWAVTQDRRAGGERWEAREFTTTAELHQSQRIPTGAPHADLPTDPKYADDLVELMGWFWTEGHIIPGGHRLTISQSHTANPENVDRIQGALTRLYGPAGGMWRESIQDNTSSFGGPVTVFHLNRDASAPLIEAAPRKRVDLGFVRSLTSAQLRLFCEVSCAADGWHDNSGRLDIWQRESDMLDAYEYALILSGRMVSRTQSGDGHCVNGWLREPVVRPVKAALANTTDGMSITAERYTGTIWCPRTPNGTWLARRRGTVYYTGNSGWELSDNIYREFVQPTVREFADQVCVKYLRPRLEASGVSPEQAARITLIDDASRLVARPNRGTNVKDAHSAIVISDASAREAWGFDDGDAPSDEEVERRTVIARGGVTPEMLAAWFNQTTNNPPLPMPAVPMPALGPAPNGETPGGADQIPSDAMAASGRGRSAGERLAAIDARLLDRLTTLADQTVARMIETAGKRVLSTLAGDQRGDPARIAARDLIRHVPDKARITATLGRDRLKELSIDAERLLEDSLGDLEDRWEMWVRQAQAQARKASSVPLFLDDVEEEAFEAKQDDRRRAARPIFAAAVVAAARSSLFSPAPQPGEPRVLPGVIREALAKAGGSSPLVSPTGAVTDAITGGPVGLVATGDDVADLWGAHGRPWTGYQWVHTYDGPSPFALEGDTAVAHLALDGVTFDAWESDELSTIGSGYEWVGNYFFVGDHPGCGCIAAPLTD